MDPKGDQLFSHLKLKIKSDFRTPNFERIGSGIEHPRSIYGSTTWISRSMKVLEDIRPWNNFTLFYGLKG